ncbi:MAG: DUF4442 domain-containing protein [Parachlamydia sp.]|nr:DUF4442 domain-containing protein [Parachlamydia sp.]
MITRSHLFYHFCNFWPPFFFSGIKVLHISKDYRQIVVRLKLRFWNANLLGTQFGGSIYAFVDPFYMIMWIKNLRSDFVVWDKAATIRFLKPGRTDLTAEFHLSEEDVAEVKAAVQEQGKMDWVRKVAIHNSQGEVVAEVEKVISIQKKR